MEAAMLALWEEVGLARAMGLVAGIGQELGQHSVVVPRYLVPVPGPSRLVWTHASEQGCPGSDAGGAAAVGSIKVAPLASQGIEIGRLNGWVTGNTQAVAPPLVADDQNDIGLAHVCSTVLAIGVPHAATAGSQ